MINVCQDCLRLNTNDIKECCHCLGDCQTMPSGDYGQFRVDMMVKKAKEACQERALMLKYPDLQIFADCSRELNDQDLILARP